MNPEISTACLRTLAGFAIDLLTLGGDREGVYEDADAMRGSLIALGIHIGDRETAEKLAAELDREIELTRNGKDSGRKLSSPDRTGIRETYHLLIDCMEAEADADKRRILGTALRFWMDFWNAA